MKRKLIVACATFVFSLAVAIKINNFQGQQLGRWAWDVYLVKAL